MVYQDYPGTQSRSLTLPLAEEAEDCALPPTPPESILTPPLPEPEDSWTSLSSNCGRLITQLSLTEYCIPPPGPLVTIYRFNTPPPQIMLYYCSPPPDYNISINIPLPSTQLDYCWLPLSPLITINTPPLVTVNTPPLVTVNTPPLVTAKTPPLVTLTTPAHETINTPSLVTTKAPPLVTINTPPLDTANTPPLVTSNNPPEDGHYLTVYSAPVLMSVSPVVPPTRRSYEADSTLLAVTDKLLQIDKERSTFQFRVYPATLDTTEEWEEEVEEWEYVDLELSLLVDEHCGL